MFYYYVYGKQEYYKQCILSLLSLRKIGEYNGDVFIYTEDEQLVNFYLDLLNLQDNVVIKQMTFYRPLFCRYKIALDLINLYPNKTITYLDNDIIVVKNIKEYLSFDYSSSLYVYEESPSKASLPFFRVKVGTKLSFINSGLFSFTADSKELFEEVLEEEKTYSEEQYKLVGDQPVFATICSSKDVNKQHLLKHQQLTNSTVNCISPTFYHHNIGFKKEGKLQHLIYYFNGINKNYTLQLWKLLGSQY